MNFVGDFESVCVSVCNGCKEQTVRSILETVEEVCIYCGEENLDSYLGKRFFCPECGEKNVQVMEPSEIGSREGITFSFYKNDEISCMHCEAEFGMAIFVEDETKPRLDDMKFKLYKKINS